MKSSSKNILESLLFKIPNIKSIYDMLELGTITSSEHPECSNIINNFTSPNVILCIGIITTCIVVQRTKKNEFHCIVIGQEVYYTKCRKGDIHKMVHDTMLIKDFIPQPLNKKIVFIDYFDKRTVKGNVYTEITHKRYVNKLVNNIVDYINYDEKDLLNYYRFVTKEVDEIEIKPIN